LSWITTLLSNSWCYGNDGVCGLDGNVLSQIKNNIVIIIMEKQ